MAGKDANKAPTEAGFYSNLSAANGDSTHATGDMHAASDQQAGVDILQARLAAMERDLASQRALAHSKEFTASAAALKSLADALALQHAQCGASHALRSLGWQLWLGVMAVAGHAQQLLSGADVAALILCRRLLLQRDPFEPAEKVSGRPGRASLLGGAFFLALVEGAWQAQEWVGPKLPKRAQRVSEGTAKGIRALRIACWAAAFVLTTSAARQACFAAADQVWGISLAAHAWAQQKAQPLLPPPAPLQNEAPSRFTAESGSAHAADPHDATDESTTHLED